MDLREEAGGAEVDREPIRGVGPAPRERGDVVVRLAGQLGAELELVGHLPVVDHHADHPAGDGVVRAADEHEGAQTPERLVLRDLIQVVAELGSERRAEAGPHLVLPLRVATVNPIDGPVHQIPLGALHPQVHHRLGVEQGEAPDLLARAVPGAVRPQEPAIDAVAESPEQGHPALLHDRRHVGAGHHVLFTKRIDHPDSTSPQLV